MGAGQTQRIVSGRLEQVKLIVHQLVFLNGQDPGRTFDLMSAVAPLRIGRGEHCEICVSDDEASRVHCLAREENGQWRIEDQDSLNGTFLNSRSIDRAVLNPGDLIRIGESMLVFCKANGSSADHLNPSYFSDNTRVRRILGAEKRRVAEDPIGADSTSGPIRKLAFLYRLSKEIYSAESVDSLLRYALTSIVQVIGAREAKICIRTNVGRLKQYVSGSHEPSHDSANMLANWVMEKDEALLIDVNENISWRGPDESVERGTALGAPIPGRGQCIGAIECFQPNDGKSFEIGDLEFLVSVGQHIGLAIENLEQHERVKRSNQQLRNQLGETKATFVGESEPIKKLRQQIARVAATDVTTLVLGESGTGKEVVSQMIHELSGRKDGPFVATNCAAFSDSLLESELFGHEKGAFTGADVRRKGQFELAHQGTIFLDEIGEMSASCQAKLLRLLEGQPFARLGGSEKIEVNIRIVAATHRNLEEMVAAGQFREDLWYRLRVVELNMPPLRERGEDLLLLAEHFLDKMRREVGHGPTSLSRDSVQAMLSHSWRGNVRELRNAIERALVLAVGDQIEPADLGLSGTTRAPIAGLGDCRASLADLERMHIARVLEHTGGNKTRACEILGITRAALYNKLKRTAAKDRNGQQEPTELQ